ncbi:MULTISPECIES: fimbrial protein [unclassified Erwinia]|uniref:fimbrial protein n=1 Tax=unclassified Erwinia TaxID=2622719 RepID=UPI0006F23177|nr:MULTISPECIES: fimbrial protein [unclassified Erwinia]KQN63253.1 hypothetical protein ASF13_19800 [Erwinia sp. Leaf53]PLV54727.1 hypothetical protein NV64_17670 [Erwinia sp. B116]
MSPMTACCKKCLTVRGALAFAAMLTGHSALAYEQGEVTPQVPHNYDVSLTTLDIKNNVAGAVIMPPPWNNSGAVYTGYIHCPDGRIKEKPRYYTATTGMTPSAINPGYFRLNDYFDVKIQVFIVNGPTPGYDVPFYDVSNQDKKSCRKNPTTDTRIESGSKGQVTFKITKPVINGVSLNSYELVKLYGRQELTPVLLNTPLTTVTLKSAIITVPDKCVVNAGNAIVVNFGDIPGNSSQLNGNNFKKDVPIKIACKGGSFDMSKLNIKLGVQPSGSGLASFSPDYLGTTGSTDRKNLGIVLKDKADNSPVIPGKFYNLKTFNNNSGSWNLTAAPIAKPGSEIPEGEFDASGSIVAEFQ